MKLRIGVPRDRFFSNMGADVGRTVEEALRLFERKGHALINVKLPSIPRMSFGCEPWSFHERLIAANGELYHPVIRQRITHAGKGCSAAYSDEKRTLELVRRAFDSTFDNVDVLITPTMAHLPKTLLQATEDEKRHAVFAAARNTEPFSTWGVPAISIPCGFASNGLPIGLQIVGRRFRDADVLSAACAYEGMRDWHTRMPAL